MIDTSIVQAATTTAMSLRDNVVASVTAAQPIITVVGIMVAVIFLLWGIYLNWWLGRY